MILKFGTDPVGGWFYWDPRGRTSEREAFRWAVEALRPVTEVLKAHQLLSVDVTRVRTVAEPHAYQDRPASSDHPVDDLLAVVGAPALGATPLGARLEGTGVVVQPAGRVEVRDVVTAGLAESGGVGTIFVETRCDAWLPFNLRGMPQQELYELNAPRLRAALEEIERRLGVRGAGESTKFAQCEGYTLVNYFDVCEEPVDIAEFGYDDTWIASS
ncbi:MAG: hypothetical protein IPH44_33905 [Myxococcales bacterium]|jgi:hypothetical protein|nr:hypothetical protein [Myxococcales bacterium]MBK7192681.1 hypothetical protein [Myxococcales bacterium]MBP6633733.1 hypothetical protein [Kofleriaceae bacterium]